MFFLLPTGIFLDVIMLKSINLATFPGPKQTHLCEAVKQFTKIHAKTFTGSWGSNGLKKFARLRGPFIYIGEVLPK